MEARTTALTHQNSAVSSIGSIQGPGVQGWKWEWLLLLLSDPLVKCLLPIPETLDSAGPEILVSKEEMFLLE